ncbi:MAG TPA: TolC family protein [Bryobacteraceae bacterium]|jgi:outer membrane protein TolC|nr:TolC family protein [Bryobacteraceae bacterium]
MTKHIRYSAIFVLAAFVLPAAAQESRLNLRELTSQALRSNPEVIAAQKSYEAARQRPTQQSSLPDPLLSLGYTSVGNPRPVAGIGREPLANAGLTVSQAIPFPGKLKLQGDMAAKDAEAEFQQYQAVQLSVVSRVKQAYVRLQHTYAASDVLTRSRSLLETLLKVTEARYSAGKAAQQDLFKAQAQISVLEMQLVKFERERRSSEAEINSILNRAPGSPLERPVDMKHPEFALTLDELFAAARENSPTVRREQKMIERTELAVNLARKEYYPDFTLNAGYYNQASMPPMYEFRADFKLPVYFWRKQRAGVNEQVSSLSQARHNYEAADQSLRFRINDDYLVAEASARLMKLYSETVLPQASLAMESSLATYETGTVDFLSVLTNFSLVIDTEMNYHEEAMSYMLALARLEEMTGRELLN